MLQILINALRETLYMVLYASLFSILIGIPFGVFMATIAKSPYRVTKVIYGTLYTMLQITQSVPYLLVMLAFIPATNWLINQHISFITATIVPLTVTGALLLAQKVYNTCITLTVKWQNNIKAMGATNKQTLLFIILPEGLASIVEASAYTASNIVGFSIIAGAFGAGGLGQLAIEKTITDPNFTCAAISILSLIAIQQIFKYTGALVIQQKHSG